MLYIFVWNKQLLNFIEFSHLPIIASRASFYNTEESPMDKSQLKLFRRQSTGIDLLIFLAYISIDSVRLPVAVYFLLNKSRSRPRQLTVIAARRQDIRRRSRRMQSKGIVRILYRYYGLVHLALEFEDCVVQLNQFGAKRDHYICIYK